MVASIKITINSHHFKVEPLSALSKEMCFEFAKRFVKIEVQGNNRTVTTFAAANASRTWFRFHINSLTEFYTFARNRGYPTDRLDITTNPLKTPSPVVLPIKKGWVPHDYQVPIIEYLVKPVAADQPKARLVGIATGAGKAQPLSARIKTPSGWTTMGKVQLGDAVTAWDGTPCVVDGVFPQGVIEACSVEFDDGRKITCSWDHLWRVYISGDGQPEILTSREMKDKMAAGRWLRIDLHKAATPEVTQQLDALLEGKVKADDNVPLILHPEALEEAQAWQELVWAAGGRARLEIMPKSFLLLVTPPMQTFGSATLAVVKIKQAPAEEMQCISISHSDKLYITDNWVVTHNTSIALMAISQLAHRVFCVVKPKYIEKWVGDFCNVLDITKKDILVIQGGSALQSLTQMALTPGDIDKYKAIIVSNRTMDNYLKAYELMGDNIDNAGYMCAPDVLLEKLDIGVLLRDEAHEEFHSVFRLDLYIHVPLTINLTATLISQDPTMMRMYEIAFPTETRYAEGEIKKYTDSYGVLYRVSPNYRLRTSERGQSSYSHNAYEDSILKNTRFTHNYANMLKYYLDRGFVKNYEPGHKAIVFASTVAMCTKLTDKLSEFYPNYSVKRYVAEDDYQENYQKPDIRVTTIGSGGTGHDIKGLTDAHMTNAIDSIQANIQAFGRLRDLKEKGTRFFFYSNEQIPKHMKYAHKKKDLMKKRAKSYTQMHFGEL